MAITEVRDEVLGCSQVGEMQVGDVLLGYLGVGLIFHSSNAHIHVT